MKSIGTKRDFLYFNNLEFVQRFGKSQNFFCSKREKATNSSRLFGEADLSRDRDRLICSFNSVYMHVLTLDFAELKSK